MILAARVKSGMEGRDKPRWAWKKENHSPIGSWNLGKTLTPISKGQIKLRRCVDPGYVCLSAPEVAWIACVSPLLCLTETFLDLHQFKKNQKNPKQV